ncbi:MAG: CPBP family intramembrane metalloprotease [Balneola sp.]|nr:MAG: CPBP family intramembrane metalloprotease [Balneola sp.]
MNPFFNQAENRPRVLIRIVVFLFLGIILLGFSVGFDLYGFEYLFAGVIILAFFHIFYRFIDQRSSLKEAGISPSKTWFLEFFVGSIAAASAMSLIFGIQWLTGDITIQGYAWNRVSSTFWLIPALGYFVKMLSVGLYEELQFRSYLIPNMKEGLTFGKVTPVQASLLAVFLSSALFGVAHIFNPNATFFSTVNILLAGIMLAFPYLLTGRLAYSVGIHFAWNYVQGGVFGFKVSGTENFYSLLTLQHHGNPIWTGGKFGPEGGIIGLLGIMIVSLIVYAHIKRSNKEIELNVMFKQRFLENQQQQ